MTLNQLHSLDELELALALVIVNVIAPPDVPKMEFEPRHLTWFKHDMLVKKFLDAFPRVKPEGHDTYRSLLEKLGVKIEIRKNIIPPLVVPPTGSTPTTSSNETIVQSTEVPQPDNTAQATSSSLYAQARV